MRLFLALLIALLPIRANAWCGQIVMSGWAAMGAAPGSIMPLSALAIYGNTWGFNNTIPQGTTFYLTQMLFQTKGLQDHIMLPCGAVSCTMMQERRSYFVLASVYTCTSQEVICNFNPPLPLQAGYNFATDSGLIDNSYNPGGGTNFVALINGFARDATCPWPQPVQGIPLGY